MKRLLLGISLFTAAQAATADQVAKLEKVEAARDGAAFVTTLTFDNEVSSDQAMIDFQGDMIQVDLAGMAAPEKREVVRVADEQIKSVFTYQSAPDVLRTRIIFKDKTAAAKFKGRVHTEAQGNILRVLVDEVDSSTVAASEQSVENDEAAVDDQVEQTIHREADPKVTPAAGPASTSAATTTAGSELAQEMGIAVSAAAAPVTTTAAESSEAAPLTPSTAVAEIKSEDEIPVLTKVAGVKEKVADPVTRLGLSLIVVLAVAGGLLLFGKYWAKKKSGLQANMQIKVLTQYALGPKKSLAIVRVAGESILIGVTDHNISMIKSLALIDDEFPEELTQGFTGELRQAAVRQLTEPQPMERQVSYTAPAIAQSKRVEEIDEEFSFGTVKDMVSTRLKGMRSL